MSRETIVFEKALNEPYRQFLAAEAFFLQAKQSLDNPSLASAQAGFSALMQVLHLLHQTNLINDTITALKRHHGILSRLLETPSVDEQALNVALQKIQHSICQIKDFDKDRQSIAKTHDFLHRARSQWQHSKLHEFDSFKVWLHQPAQERQELFQQWLHAIRTYEQVIQFILNLTRESAYPTRETAQKGKFHTTLNHPGCQMVRVSMALSPHYPEIQVINKTLRVQFYQTDYKHGQKPALVDTNVSFELTRCLF